MFGENNCERNTWGTREGIMIDGDGLDNSYFYMKIK